MGFSKDIVYMLYEALTIKRHEDLKEFESTNYDLCKQCGGECCKNCGCHFSPRDFRELSFEYLKKQIQKGFISIEWVDGEMFYRSGGCYILRIRNKGKEIVDSSFERSPCILLTESGCKLDYERRPLGGKALIPFIRKEVYSNEKQLKCYSEYDIAACFDEWKQYQDVVVKLVKYFK